MLRLLHRILHTLSWSCLALSICAQQYGYVQYNSESDAPFDQATTVLADTAGYIWVGSGDGLYRFDGVEFELYSLHTQSQSIHQLHARNDHLLFVNDLGLYQIDDVLTQPAVRPLLEGDIQETADFPFYPNDLSLGVGEDLWLSQSNHSVASWRNGQFRTYPFSDSEKEQRLAIQMDSEGRIWALSPTDGLFVFNDETDSFEQKLSLQNGQSMLIHGEYLLIGGESLLVYRLRNGVPRLRRTISLEEDIVTALSVDANDQYFIGTQNGQLYILPELTQSLQAVYGSSEAHRVEELDFGQIHKIYLTREQNSTNDQLWICSETGLWLLQERFFETVENLPLVNPISIAFGKQGQAYAPLNYLFEITPQDEAFTARPILNNMQVTAAAQDEAGFLWVARSTPRVELTKYLNGNAVRRYGEFHERGESIFKLYADRQGNMWFCQAPLKTPIVGVAKIQADGQVVYYDEIKGFSSRVLAIKEGARGEIYTAGIGEEAYLHRFNPEEDRFENLSLPLPFKARHNFEAHDLTIDDRGVVWLATTDGLLCYDGEKISLIQDDVLGQEEVRGVTHYANNSIWVSTATKGLVYYQQNTSTVLGELAGLPAIISAYRCITTDAGGRLWAGTAEGLVYSRRPAGTLPFSNPPKLRSVLVDQKPSSGNWEEQLTIQRGQELELQFTNLSYPGRDVEYQYRLMLQADRQVMLEEQHWEFMPGGNELTLTATPIGNYTLELRARQTGGYQWSQPKELQLTVFLPWYRQGWFIYGLGSLLLLGLAYYFRFYVQRRFRRLQQILNRSNEALARKEIQLNEKIQEFEEQQAELDNANSNIQTLELFVKQMPEKASWNDIITAMGKAVKQAADINAFEIAFKEGNEIVHKGYSDQERSGYTFRSKPFDAKSSLTCWAMANNREVLINDFDTEHTQYIEQKDAYRFHSLVFIPFQLENNQQVVLCAYSIHKDQYDANDLTMFRILAQFIYFSIHEEIKKVI